MERHSVGSSAAAPSPRWRRAQPAQSYDAAMASLPELARFRTALDAADVEHLQRLVAEWGLLADLCFSDLLLWARSDRDEELFVILDHIRPTTGQTIYRQDRTGEEVRDDARPLLARSFREGSFVEGGVEDARLGESLGVFCVPVRNGGRLVAVLTRESIPNLGRHQGALGVKYVGVFHRVSRAAWCNPKCLGTTDFLHR